MAGWAGLHRLGAPGTGCCRPGGAEARGLADGAYDTVGLWLGLPERAVVVVRTAKNRRLRELPGWSRPRAAAQVRGGGTAAGEWLQERQGFQKTLVDVRGRTMQMRYRVLGPYVRERAAEVRSS